jgi:hypothetical protein
MQLHQNLTAKIIVLASFRINEYFTNFASVSAAYKLAI